MAISGIGIAYALSGTVLVWSGVKNATLQDTLTSFLHGQLPAANPTGPIQIGLNNNSSGSGSGQSATATSSAVANDALKYVGHKYVWGGPSNVNGGWDCSSFVNYVLGHDLGMQIPGGSWAKATNNGNSHGPTTVSYLAWSGAATVSNSASAAQAGDLCVWQTHIGIAIGNGQMVSALNTHEGTKVTSITGQVPGEILFVRRIKSTESPALGGIYPTPSGQSNTLPGA